VKARAKLPGNWCGHVRGEPRLSLTCPVVAGLPKVLEKAMERCKDIALRPRRFASLRGERIQRMLPYVRKHRDPKSELLEALGLVAQRLFRGASLITHRVGKPYRDRRYVSGPGIKNFARDTGLNDRRVRRALRFGEELRWWSAHRGREEYRPKSNKPCKCCPEGAHLWSKKRYASFNTVYRISEGFIGELRLTAEWAKQKEKALRRDDEARRVAALSDVKQINLDKERQAIAAKSVQFAADFTARQVERLSRVQRRALSVQMRRLQLEHPDWGLDRIELEARRRL
jgi:hypothetical protein